MWHCLVSLVVAARTERWSLYWLLAYVHCAMGCCMCPVPAAFRGGPGIASCGVMLPVCILLCDCVCAGMFFVLTTASCMAAAAARQGGHITRVGCCAESNTRPNTTGCGPNLVCPEQPPTQHVAASQAGLLCYCSRAAVCCCRPLPVSFILGNRSGSSPAAAGSCRQQHAPCLPAQAKLPSRLHISSLLRCYSVGAVDTTRVLSYSCRIVHGQL